MGPTIEKFHFKNMSDVVFTISLLPWEFEQRHYVLNYPLPSSLSGEGVYPVSPGEPAGGTPRHENRLVQRQELSHACQK